MEDIVPVMCEGVRIGSLKIYQRNDKKIIAELRYSGFVMGGELTKPLPEIEYEFENIVLVKRKK